MTEKCYSVLYNGHSECPGDSVFSVEKVFYGKNAEEKAIRLAILLNVKYLEEIGDLDPIKILCNTNKSPEENLEEYIKTLDYSNGNLRYISSFYNHSLCELDIECD